MKFGLHYQLPCSPSQSPVQRYRDTIEQCVCAETLGFESVWPVEQHFNPNLSSIPAPLLLLSAVAERTTNLRLGIAVILLSLSHPVRVAEEIATLDVISNGRVEFGIGRGSIPTHFSGFGLKQAESRERMMEGLDLIRHIWTHERCSYQGKFWQVENISVIPRPVQQPHPPIRLAANSKESFEQFGRMGEPIFVAAQVNPFRKIRELLPIYHQERKAAGHPDTSGEDVTLLMPLYVGENHEQMRHDLEPSIRHFLAQVASIYAMAGPVLEGRLKEVMERVRSMTYDQMREVMAVFETPEACVERLKEFQQEFGMGRVICWFNPGGMVPHEKVLRSMELFAKKVMPHFRG
ncbi:MAG: LLM class flavin-dependent oxidoreductase [Deltaproteobacteria bacterium]|nr:LLM class flavin-dependent oxidoreductase [Deltaproteobacteria bacterium]